MRRCVQMIKGLKKICTNNKEPLYLANSSDILKLIRELNLLEIYPNLANAADFSYTSDCPFSFKESSPMKQLDKTMERIVEVKRVVEAYNMGEYGDESSIQHHSEQRKPLVSTNLVVNLKITARDIILQPFVYDLNHQEIEEDPCSNSREEFGKPRLD